MIAATAPRSLARPRARNVATRTALQWIRSVAPASRPKDIDPGSMVGTSTITPAVAAASVARAFQLARSSTTVAQLRPLAPQIPEPGNVAAPVR